MLLEKILFFGSLLTLAVIVLCRVLRPQWGKQVEMPWYLDWSVALFPVLLFVLILRGFIAEPFRIPSGSMLPTLEVGDFILVNKFTYGLRLPVTHTKIVDVNDPERGDIVVFRYPPDESLSYIKRLIGLPGDIVEYRNRTLFINGAKVKSYRDEDYLAFGETRPQNRETQFLPRAEGFAEYSAIFNKSGRFELPTKLVVPEGHYFMMGDNRDNSADSRSWGVVPKANVVGKAFYIWMHINTNTGGGFNFDRIGTRILPEIVDKPDLN